MKSVQQHYDDVMSLGAPLPIVDVELNGARGLILGRDLPALIPAPPFTNSKRDGFAVRAADVAPGTALPVAADIHVGDGEPAPLEPGTAARIQVGAMIPEGADAVLEAHLAEGDLDSVLGEETPTSVVPKEAIRAGRNVRHEGEDLAAGTLSFFSGTRLRATHLAGLAALGYSAVPVHRRPRVGILTTGSELRPIGAPLEPGTVHDSGAVLVAEMVADRGAVALPFACHKDSMEAFDNELKTLATQVDLIITVGGTDAGSKDVVYRTLKDEGVSFDFIAAQPGRSQGWGTITVERRAGLEDEDETRDVPILCLPGNPVSTFVSMWLYGIPLLTLLFGREPGSLDSLFHPAAAGSNWTKEPGRIQFLPCVPGGLPRADKEAVMPASSGGSASHLIGTLPRATGLARVAEDRGNVRAGDTVDVMWFADQRRFS